MFFICANKFGNRHEYADFELYTLFKRLGHDISAIFLSAFNQVPCLILKHNSRNYKQCMTEKAREKTKSYCKINECNRFYNNNQYS